MATEQTAAAADAVADDDTTDDTTTATNTGAGKDNAASDPKSGGSDAKSGGSNAKSSGSGSGKSDSGTAYLNTTAGPLVYDKAGHTVAGGEWTPEVNLDAIGRPLRQRRFLLPISEL